MNVHKGEPGNEAIVPIAPHIVQATASAVQLCSVSHYYLLFFTANSSCNTETIMLEVYILMDTLTCMQHKSVA